MAESEDKNGLVYLLAGFGLGAIIGAAAGVLFAPKAGDEIRDELGSKAKELKGRTQEWIAEQKAKRAVIGDPEEAGA
jgi:gas vesicle protein